MRQSYRAQSGQLNAQILETSIPSNQGDSGGPVLDDQGRLVAITMGGDLKKSLITFGIDVVELKAL